MDRRITVTLMAIVLAVLLASCSVVFQAGISGKVVTDDGTGTASVSDVNVFAYTDQSLRDSDYTKFVNNEITRPSSGAGYVATTSTNANGEFTVNKVVWETKKSEFGKTADVNKLYLIFYHEDYTPAKYDATIISDSTNADNVYVNISSNKDYATINVNIYDVSTGYAMTSACTLEYLVEGNTESDTVVATGAATLQIKFPKDTTPDVTLTLTSTGTNWTMVDSSGAVQTSYSLTDVAAGTTSVKLFMKNYEFTMPGFSGDIDGKVEASSDYTDNMGTTDVNDNLPIWLAYYGTDSKWHPFKDTITAGAKTYASQTTAGTEIYYTHGAFSGVGNSTSLVINEDTYDDITTWSSYTGKTLTVRLAIVVDEFDDSTAKEYDAYPFDYTPGVSNSNLGHIDLILSGATNAITVETE